MTPQQKDLILGALENAGKTLEILWVSHHANRADDAIDWCDAAIKELEAMPTEEV